jgi:hypothetical protein
MNSIDLKKLELHILEKEKQSLNIRLLEKKNQKEKEKLKKRIANLMKKQKEWLG